MTARRCAAWLPAVRGRRANVIPLIRRGTRLMLVLLWTLAIVAAVLSGWLLLHHARTHTEATAFSLEQAARRTITLAAFVVEEYEEFLGTRGDVAALPKTRRVQKSCGRCRSGCRSTASSGWHCRMALGPSRRVYCRLRPRI